MVTDALTGKMGELQASIDALNTTISQQETTISELQAKIGELQTTNADFWGGIVQQATTAQQTVTTQQDGRNTDFFNSIMEITCPN